MIRARIIDHDDTPEGSHLSASIEWDQEQFILNIEANTALNHQSGDALCAATLQAAMRLGYPLHIDAPMCPQLLESLDTLMEYWTAWHPELKKVQVHAPVATPIARRFPPRTASFFTGGVDSSYTLLKHQSEIAFLIYVYGFDIPLANIELQHIVRERLRDAASHYGKPLIEMRTNYRAFIDRFAEWGTYAYGGAMVMMAHFLTGEVDKVYFPTGATIHSLIPLGSHPLSDPLWSSCFLRIMHDGVALRRHERMKRVLQDPKARTYLRVCWQNPDNAYNCCRCEKCIRTMIALEALGGLDQCPTFPLPLTEDIVAKIPLTSYSDRTFAYQNLALLRENQRRPDLQHILNTRLWAYRKTDPEPHTRLVHPPSFRLRHLFKRA